MSLQFLGWGEGVGSSEVLTEEVLFLAPLRALRIDIYLFRELGVQPKQWALELPGDSRYLLAGSYNFWASGPAPVN